MIRQLRERRDRATEHHDAALARNPSREGDVFTQELQGVIKELRLVAETADDPSSDPVEVSKTYRWLGDAYFDLARGKDVDTLMLGAQAYQRSAELLADAEAPLEKAKLDFNYGNTLRGLSEGTDIGLLEAAQTRYESAARGFRNYHLSDHAATVEQQLRSLDPQLRLARKQSQLQRGYGRLEQMQERLGGDVDGRCAIVRKGDGLEPIGQGGAGEEAGVLDAGFQVAGRIVADHDDVGPDPIEAAEHIEKHQRYQDRPRPQ